MEMENKEEWREIIQSIDNLYPWPFIQATFRLYPFINNFFSVPGNDNKIT